MDFSYSPKVKELIKKLSAFMEDYIYPNERVYEEQLNAQESRWSGVPPIMEELKEKAKKEGLWNLVFARQRIRCGINECRIRAALRNYGPFAHRSGSVQLQCAGYRQYGSARPLWHRGAKEKMADPALERGNSLLLFDDGAACRVE